MMWPATSNAIARAEHAKAFSKIIEGRRTHFSTHRIASHLSHFTSHAVPSTPFSLLCGGLPATGVLQQRAIDLVRREVDVSDDGAADEDVLDGAQVRVLQLVQNHHVVEFDVQILVDGLEGAADADVVFQLDGHGLLGQGFEEARQTGRE